MTRTIDLKDWLAAADAARRRVAAIEDAFAEPYRRDRPRDPGEAAFLRQAGTPESLVGPSSDSDARRAFAVPPRSGEFRGLNLAGLDPADSDERRILIEAEHHDLLDLEEHDVRNTDPSLHVVMHEIVANQLWEDDPPETWQTAKRLLAAGYRRHEILHMLGSAVIPQVWDALHEGRQPDHERYVRALADLPGSWERRASGERRTKRGRPAKPRKAARAARKRNRRG